MIVLELVTIAYPPPFREITLRTSIDGWEAHDIAGTYRADRWVFELADPRYRGGFLAKFALDRTVWANGGDLVVPPADDARHVYYPAGFGGFGAPVAPVIELGQVHTKVIDRLPPDPEDRVHDVIVIGSGMAGGVLAERLADSGLRTLVIEAGGIPLETHIANLPRRHQNPTEFTKHIWDRWRDFRVINYDGGDGNVYQGAQAFNLGGRSLFWGGFIPRMSSWELDYWPQRLKWDLEDSYYQLAEDVMGRSGAPVTQYGRTVQRALRRLLPDYQHFNAPVAVQTNVAAGNGIAAGLFSTTDLLLESLRSSGPLGQDNLALRVHTQAIRVEPGNPVVVHCRDIVSGEEIRFRGRVAVLSCGCLESARLARRSGLGNALVGQGVSDHPIAYTHFEIPPDSPYYDRFGSVKLLSQPVEPRSGDARDPFNILLELGADFNQGRYLDEDILAAAAAKRSMLCEIVFLSNMELLQENRLDFDAARDFRPIAHIRNPGLAPAVRDRVAAITEAILTELRGTRIASGEGNGGLGGVAHEVGSLRMAVRDSNNIGKRRQAPLDGVVDEDGRFPDHENIYACDLSIFPTSPAANPSLTAVALAIRLADRLAARLGAA